MIPTAFLRRMPLLVVPVVAACLALPLTAAGQGAEGAFERTLQVAGPVDLEVQSGSGRIQVEPGAAGSVRISARLKADNSWFAGSDVEKRLRQIEQNPPIEQQGNVIRIGRFADDDLARNISISYDLVVPAGTKLGAHTGSGSIAVGDIAGPAAVRSGSGSIVVGRVSGRVEASTGSGSIKVNGAGGLEARSGSGSIQATGVAGPTTANTGSGSIAIAQTGKGDVTVSAGSGGITLTGLNGAATVNCSSGSITIDGTPAAPWSIHASSGTITITMPPDAAFELDARSNSGNIDSVHPVTMTVTGNVERHRVAGKVRGGGPLVQVSSSSGSIRIK